MTDLFNVRVTAIGEVRDHDGNLISAEPVEANLTLTADQIRALNLGEPS